MRWPPSPCSLCGVNPMCAMTGMPADDDAPDLLGAAHAALELDRVRPRFLHEPERGVQRLVRPVSYVPNGMSATTKARLTAPATARVAG